jgi:arylsulfatase A-like enzyme
MTKTKKPNILVFLTDQQRWDSVGYHNPALNTTPILDKMASEGVKLQYAFTCQPVCVPARASIQTGKYATEVGCHTNSKFLSPGEKTIAHYLKGGGYEAGYIGKWHLAGTRTQPVPIERRGGYTDFWLGADLLEFTSQPYGGTIYDMENNPIRFTKGRIEALTDYALGYLRSLDGKEPFFLFLSYLEPHHQNDKKRFIAPEVYARMFKDAPVPGDLKALTGDWQENLSDYYGNCRCLDDNLGRILNELHSLSIAEDTVVIFTSDHGCHFKTRNEEYKRAPHEAAVRIPMVIDGPGFKGGKEIHQLVSLIDLAPTILDIGGVEIPHDMQGRSLLPLIDGKANDWPEDVFIQISGSEVGRAIRTKRWKYSVYAPDKDPELDSDSDTYVEEHLYDLESDPYELNDLIKESKYRGIRKSLAERLKQRIFQYEHKEVQILV